jgi:DNA-binding NarL/FixJ family response regulator
MRNVAPKHTTGIRILLYTRHPFVAAGVGSVLSGSAEFELAGWCGTLAATGDRLRSDTPDILLVHLASRISLAELGQLWPAAARSRVVLWGDAIEGEFAFQAMLLGARAIFPNHTKVDDLLAGLLNVHRGVLCFEKQLMDDVLHRKRVTLTRREGQIVSLVAQGLKNKAIGYTLGITEGTVKVYLYKLFKKLGMNDRLDMALYGLKNLFAGETGLEDTPDGHPGVPGTPDVFAPRTLPLQSRVN